MQVGSDALDSSFELVRELGAGTSGVVWLAQDRYASAPVALKILHRRTPTAERRFQSEFRSIADLTHPNVVSFYELIFTNDQWYIVMEYVDGVPLDQALGLRRVADQTEHTEEGRQTAQQEPTLSVSERSIVDWRAPVERARVLKLLLPLLDGMQAIHRSGIVHRDLKPSNVLVERGTDRVVIVDLGLAHTAEDPPPQAAGTPIYSAPEVHEREAVGPAADAFAFGVMLYEALTHTRPFVGSAAQLIASKRDSQVVAPNVLNPTIPADISALCLALLSPNPTERPSLSACRMRLLEKNSALTDRSDESTNDELIGRSDELSTLLAEVDLAPEQLGVCWVSGESGIGKSALFTEFCRRAERQGALVVRVRCHTFAAVPYSAVTLVHRGLQLQRHAILAEDRSSLQASFESLWTETHDSSESTSVHGQKRTQGAECLALLLAAFAKTQTVIVLIDDIQWCDAESVSVLNALLRRPLKNVQFCFASRTNVLRDSPVERLRTLAESSAIHRYRSLELLPLSLVESAKLVRILALRNGGISQTEVQRLAQLSLGNPLFIKALVRSPLIGTEATTLDARLVQWGRTVSKDASVLLQLLVVAGVALTQSSIAIAAGLLGCDWRRALRELVLSDLVKRLPDGREGVSLFEIAHDRIREALAATIENELSRTLSRVLVLALQKLLSRGETDAEVSALMGLHLERSGASAAGEYLLGSAAMSAKQGAYHRAVSFYQRALELLESTTTATLTKQNAIEIALAEALARVGRSGEAADRYCNVAARCWGAERQRLTIEAGRQLLIAGRVDDGRELLQKVAEELHVPFEVSVTRTARRWLFRRRPAVTTAEQVQLSLSLMQTIIEGLALISPRETVLVHLYRRTLLNRVHAPPEQQARSMLGDVMFLGAVGALGDQFAHRTFTALANVLTSVPSSSNLHSLAFEVRAIYAVQRGQYAEGLRYFELAEQRTPGRFEYHSWEEITGEHFRAWALFYAGNYAELAQRIPASARIAEETESPFVAVDFRSQHAIAAWLVTDNPTIATRELRAAQARWPLAVGQVQAYYALVAQVDIALYQRDAQSAWSAVQSQSQFAQRSNVFWVEGLRIDYAALRCRVALAMLHDTAQSNKASPIIWSTLLAAVAQLRAEPADGAQALGYLFQAMLETRWRQPQSARLHLEKAIHHANLSGMCGYRACAQVLMGALATDDASTRAQREGIAFFHQQGVKNIPAFLAMLVPGLQSALPRTFSHVWSDAR